MAQTRQRKSVKGKLKPLQNRREMAERIDKMKDNRYLRLFLLSLLPVLFLIFGLVMFPPWGGTPARDEAETVVESVGKADPGARGKEGGREDSRPAEEDERPRRNRRSEDPEQDLVEPKPEKEVESAKSDGQIPKRTGTDRGRKTPAKRTGGVAEPKKGVVPPHLKSELENFEATFQTPLRVGRLELQGKTIKAVELKPSKGHNSSVRVYKFDNFLTERECNGLIQAHRKHVHEHSAVDPIFCFDDISTLKKHLKDANKKSTMISKNDFIPGTTCVKSNYSSELKGFLKWSYSTAFYPGESPFSKLFEDRVSEATGLMASNGGKFQITSYGEGVGYKTHTDCIVGGRDQRDRMATILVYLQDVTEGGETEFLELGIKVKPKKGMAIVWNNMDGSGNCEPLSLHTAAKVKEGHKYILQRWYYYKSFYSLGSRPREPAVPERLSETARVACDEYEHGSCRWYDEWNNDHLTEYLEQMRYLP